MKAEEFLEEKILQSSAGIILEYYYNFGKMTNKQIDDRSRTV